MIRPFKYNKLKFEWMNGYLKFYGCNYHIYFEEDEEADDKICGELNLLRSYGETF